MAVKVASEIVASDEATWASIKAKVAAGGLAYSLDDATMTARMTFTADWNPEVGLSELKREEL